MAYEARRQSHDRAYGHRQCALRCMASRVLRGVVVLSLVCVLVPCASAQPASEPDGTEEASALASPLSPDSPEGTSKEDAAIQGASDAQEGTQGSSGQEQAADNTSQTNDAPQASSTSQDETFEDQLTEANEAQPTATADDDVSTASYSDVESMGLTMYACVYEPKAESKPNGSCNGYVARQIDPAEKNMTAVSTTKSKRFLIKGAYTDNAYYLIPLSYFETVFEDAGYVFSEEDAKQGICPFYYSGSGFILSNSSSLASYEQLDNAWYVKIKAFQSDGLVGAVFYVQLTEATDTLSPASTVINLFDYWTTSNRLDDDNHASTEAEMEAGINAGHALKFGKQIPEGYGDINFSWGGTDTRSKVTQGIVNKTLGSDGYPQFSGVSTSAQRSIENISQYLGADKQESFAYLFDPKTEFAGKQSFYNVSNLLSRNAEGYYCYDSTQRATELDEASNNMTVYTSPTVYSTEAFSSETGFGSGQFFPFNDAHQSAMLSDEESPLNHYFGMSMTTRFIQEHGGYTTAERTVPMAFDFSGDNDVWIFIDGVLVADLGGLRSAASVTINFATGEVSIEDNYDAKNGATTGTQSTTLHEAFVAALPSGDYRLDASEWQTNTTTDKSGNEVTYTTFADGTTHTLKFYYLERGNYDSNLNLKFNLNEIPSTSIYKVDQYGDALEGATFAAYKAVKGTNNTGYYYILDSYTETPSGWKESWNVDEKRQVYDSSGNEPILSKWQDGWYIDPDTGNVFASEGAYKRAKNGEAVAPIITAGYYDTTDEHGSMKFTDEDDMPFTEGELKTKLTGTGADGGCFILREVSIPSGYRTVSAETWLTFDSSHMICENTYQSGVWASPNAQVTATNTLHVVSSERNDDVVDKMITDGAIGFAINSEGNWTIPYYDVEHGSATGTLFAVVLKRNGADLTNVDSWAPLYGSDTSGYTVINNNGITGYEETKVDEKGNVVVDENGNPVKVTYTTQIDAVIAAAQKAQAYGSSKFEFSPSGMQVTLENLPGKISRYYTYLQNLEGGQLLSSSANAEKYRNGEDPQYFVAYYWTSANSVGEATSANTVRVISRNGVEQGYNGFSIQWGTIIEVPNMENRLFFQKTNGVQNADGSPVLLDGAVFALYEAYDAYSDKDKTNYVYYAGTTSSTGEGGSKVYVGILSADGNTGDAIVFGSKTNDSGAEEAYVIGRGSYSINTGGIDVDSKTGEVSGADIGTIMVKVDEATQPDGSTAAQTFYVFPAKNAKFDSEGNCETLVGATHDTCEYVSEEGTGHFTNLKDGKYYLREIYAPSGYDLNTTDIPVLVNNNGVYAYAGDEGSLDDGVSVGNGTGYLTKTLDVFASPGEIDETLTWVYAALIQNNTAGFSAFDEVSGDVITIDGTETWSFVGKGTETRTGYGNVLLEPTQGETTEQLRSKALKTYLVYSGDLAAEENQELIFDYVPNMQRTNEQGDLLGEGVLRLFTDEGWSDLAIYQDTDFGKANKTNIAGNAITYYEDLSKLGNIANLFSSSTFVRVTDQPLSEDPDEDPGYQLPDTGGVGALCYLIFGTLFMTGAAICGFGVRRARMRKVQ